MRVRGWVCVKRGRLPGLEVLGLWPSPLQLLSLRFEPSRFVVPGSLHSCAFGKAGIDVVRELDGAIKDPGFDHEVANDIEVRLVRRKGGIDNTGDRIGQSPAQQLWILMIVEAAHEVGCVLSIGTSFLKPQSRPGNTIHEHLHCLRPFVNNILADDQDARHIVRPVVPGLEKHSSKPPHLGLRWKRLPHGEGINGTRRQRSGNVRRCHFHQPHFAGLNAELFQHAKHDQPFIREPTWNGNSAAPQIQRTLYRSGLPYNDRTSVPMAEVDDFNRHPLGAQGDAPSVRP